MHIASPDTKKDAAQTWCLRAAIALLAVCCLMTGSTGVTLGGDSWFMQILLAIGLGICTVGAALLLPYIEKARRFGFGSAAILAIAWGVFTVGEGLGHLLLIANQRQTVNLEAKLQTTGYSDVLKGRDEQEAKKTLLTARLAELRGTLKKAVETTVSGWTVTTVPASSAELVPQIKAKQLEVDNESKRNGCKAKCEARTNELAHLQKLKGMAEEIERTQKQIDASEIGLENARKTLAGMKPGNSSADAQAGVLAKIIRASLRPDEDSKEGANLAVEVFFALLFTIGPMTLFYVSQKDWTAEPRKRGGSSWLSRAMGWITGKEQAPAEPHSDTVARDTAQIHNAPSSPTHTTHQIMQPVIVEDGKWAAMIARLKADPRTAHMIPA